MAREPGDRIIPKLIPVIRDTIVATKRSLAGHEKEVRRKATQEIIDALGAGIADFYRPLVDKMLEQDDETLSPEVRTLLEQAKSGEHQEQAIAGLLMGGVSGALSTLLNNELAPLIYPIVGRNPYIEIAPPEAAGAVARGILGYGTGENLASRQGFDRNAFAVMYQLSQASLDVSTLLALRNRGLIDPGEVDFWLKRAGYHDNVITPLKGLARQLLPPADAALAVLRNNMSHADGVEVSAKQGVSASDFEILIGNTGEPPGIMDMLSMFRRGIIDKATLERGILQSRVRNEWIPAIEATRFTPMTTADAIAAAVQTHIPEQQARHIAEMNGLQADDFNALLETAGEPLSKTEMLHLHRMGKATAEEVKQALRESRLKNKYVNQALDLTVQILPMDTVRRLYVDGVFTEEQATKSLQQLGYEDFAVKAILKSGHVTKTTKSRDLTEGMIVRLYVEHIISAGELHTRLKHLGYTDHEADDIQELSDKQLEMAERNNAVAHVRSAYTGHKISEADAQHMLHALLVPAVTVEKLMADWNLERKSAVRMLTPAQIISAWRLSLLDTPVALAKLVNLGYSGADAGLLLEIANKGPLTPAQQQ